MIQRELVVESVRIGRPRAKPPVSQLPGAFFVAILDKGDDNILPSLRSQLVASNHAWYHKL